MGRDPEGGLAVDRIKILVDTDPGTDFDDALALTYLARHPRCELLGVTVVTGEPEKRAAIAEVTLRAEGRNDVPIHLGRAEPIVGQGQPECQQYGSIRELPHRLDRPAGTAVEFLRETILAHEGEVVLLTIGALTNIAELVTAEPEILTKLRSHVAMLGRWTRSGPEWNVMVDVEATRIVFDAPSVPRRLIGLDVTEQCRMNGDGVDKVLAAERYAPHRAMGRRFLQDAELVTFHDPLAAAVIFKPELCDWQSGSPSVSRDGETSFAPGGSDLYASTIDADAFFADFRSVCGR